MAKIPFTPLSTGLRKKTFIVTKSLGRHTRFYDVTFVGAITKSRKEVISFVMSAHPHEHNWAPTARILMKLIFWQLFGNLPRKSKFVENLTTIRGTLHEDLCKCMASSRWLLRLQCFTQKSVEMINTHFVVNIPPPKKNRAPYKKMWKTHKMLSWVSTEKMVTRKRHNVWVHVHCLSGSHLGTFANHIELQLLTSGIACHVTWSLAS
jgi:hypothetical protein